jgi:replicative DNA helicase
MTAALEGIDPEIPSDLDAEMAVLGSMLQSPSAAADCAEILAAADFARPAHREIFEAIAEVADGGDIPGLVTVKAALEQRGTIARCGGATYLVDLSAAVPSVANATWFAARVRECAVRWRLAQAGTGVRAAALTGQADLADRVEQVYRVLEEASGEAVPVRARSAADLVIPVLEALEAGPQAAEPGIASGWTDLDLLIPGLKPGQLVTVGARPGVGKSVVMLNWAAHAALALGVPVLMCSLEMSASECMERLIASVGRVDYGRIRTCQVEARDWERVEKASRRITGSPNLMINDDPYIGIAGIRSELRSMRRAGHPAGLVIVDYLQLMTVTGKSENRQAEVSALGRGLKLLAKEFGVPVMIGSQLNRGPEQRTDHRPLLSDLRESGSIEQDSDVVILLHREDMYEPESPRAGEIDLIVAKNRQGQKATVTLTFRGSVQAVAEMFRGAAPAARPWEEAA